MGSPFWQLACWGDSLTAGLLNDETFSYEYYLSNKLTDGTTITNCGVGGEDSLTIAARQGSIPMRLKNEVEIPTDTTAVVIGNLADSGLLSTWGDGTYNVKPLLQEGWQTTGKSKINNVIINNVELILKWTGINNVDEDGEYTLERVANGDAVTLDANSIVNTYGSTHFKNLDFSIFLVGTNGGWSNPTDLLNQYIAITEYSQAKYPIVIGFHVGDVSYLSGIETLLSIQFGDNFINIREYLSTTALSDLGLTPTAQDLIDMAAGHCPTQLLYDTVHWNAKGYEAVANRIYQKIIELQYNN